ncbi:MAG: type IV secretion system DNA-binding domain-containing protein [Candidatus Gracilibacteria bacterium]|jgi:hypothetical protein|nr:type IV secretion system DNA-binding domain-containing protein [Candidatus Gracilibacteria bacterium]
MEYIIIYTLVGITALSISAYYLFKWWSFYIKEKERAIDLVFLQILIPKKDSREDRESDGEEFGSAKDWQKIAGVMQQFFASMHALRSSRFKHKFIGQNYFVCEYAVIDSEIFFYIALPSSEKELAEKQITSFYPDAVIDEVDPPNIFKPKSKVACCYLSMSTNYAYPIRTIQTLEKDPLNNITNALSKIKPEEGIGIQIMCRPLGPEWQNKAQSIADGLGSSKKSKSLLSYINPLSWFATIFNIIVHGADKMDFSNKDDGSDPVSSVTQEKIKAIEEKTNKAGFDIIIRLIATAPDKRTAEGQLGNVKAAFEQFTAQGMNGLSCTYHHSEKKLIRDYIYRNFSRGFWTSLWRFFSIREWDQVVSTEELTSLFHFPNIRYNPSLSIKWQDFKIVSGPHNLPKKGLLLGHNVFRGEKREVRIKQDDRRRHFYAIGKSGTGKSTILESMIRQDLENGNGLCVVDPHGDLVEAMLLRVPRERADDVVLFDPGDLERPMGLNLLEADRPEDKEFVAQEALGIFIKLFGEEIMGPRLQHYFRNGVLTLMEDEKEGATLLDIMRLFTDENFQKMKTTKVKNPVVRAFWEKEMAKSGQREKEEIIPYFASKFGPFTTNAQIRNILGQTKSGFNFRDVMDNKKILFVNLSKGKLGDINAKLLGMIIVSKIQMAAMGRVDTPEHERNDFYLYVDEFQNFVTDSFASILSEARKYRLNLIVAHQYISQITKMHEGGKGAQEDHTIKDAVFGNVGSMMCFKIGAQDAEYMAKEFAPIFSEQDFVNIANYQAYIKLNIDNATSKGFSMATIYDPTGKDYQGAEAYRQLSRLKFARDKSFVEKEIARRVT